MDKWEFYQHIDGRWWWRNVTLNRTTESADRFDAFIQVVRDAVRHGFRSGFSPTRRLSLPRNKVPSQPPCRVDPVRR